MARAGYLRNWNSHRIDRCAGLLAVAAARRPRCQSGLALERQLFMYAREVKETTNDSRRCACREARQAIGVLA